MPTSERRQESDRSAKNCSFVVRILHTENGTWQGRIGHVQTGQMQSFQSCLEMLEFMTVKVRKQESEGDDQEYEKAAK